MFVLQEVLTLAQKKAFLELPVRLYREDPNWIRPLDVDIERVFDPVNNALIGEGNCIRWILLDSDGQTVGRVAAFFNRSAILEDPIGGMGFFECIHDRGAAFMLFDACRDFLLKAGLKGMDGPVNFGDRDHWWGLLVDGFYPPNYGIPYHLKYYREFFEEYGFQNYFNQYTYHCPLYGRKLDSFVHAKAERVTRDPRYSFRTFEKKKARQYAADFMEIYNKGWAEYTGVEKMTLDHALRLMNKLKPIMDERLLWFGYFEDQPVAFFLMVPDINQVIRYLNGKFNLWSMIRFLYYKNIARKINKCLGIIFGVVPGHQGKGVESAIIVHFEHQVFDKGIPYRDLEMNWIGDFNPAMMRVASQVGGKILKTHITYRYLFDRTAPFTRCPRVNSRSKRNLEDPVYSTQVSESV